MTLGLLQRFYWWIGTAESVKWWIRRCYTSQACKSTLNTVRRPLTSLPLPSRPGQTIWFDLLGPLPATTKGNDYFFRIELTSRHAEAYAITKGEKNTEGCAARLVHDYITRRGYRGYPNTFFVASRSGICTSSVSRGFQDVRLSEKIYEIKPFPNQRLGRKTGSYLVLHASYLITDDQKNWDEMLLHAIAAHSNKVIRGTGLAPNGIHIGRYLVYRWLFERVDLIISS